jgi:hypothetical protein
MIEDKSSNFIKVPKRAQGEQSQVNGRKKNRTNGSARLRKNKSSRLNRWAITGISIGSLNIAGLSMFKIWMILETHTVDVLCLQETWLTTSNVQLNIPGY